MWHEAEKETTRLLKTAAENPRFSPFPARAAPWRYDYHIRQFSCNDDRQKSLKSNSHKDENICSSFLQVMQRWTKDRTDVSRW